MLKCRLLSSHIRFSWSALSLGERQQSIRFCSFLACPCLYDSKDRIVDENNPLPFSCALRYNLFSLYPNITVLTTLTSIKERRKRVEFHNEREPITWQSPRLTESILDVPRPTLCEAMSTPSPPEARSPDTGPMEPEPQVQTSETEESPMEQIQETLTEGQIDNVRRIQTMSTCPKWIYYSVSWVMLFTSFAVIIAGIISRQEDGWGSAFIV
jgi:hypothetical protein